MKNIMIKIASGVLFSMMGFIIFTMLTGYVSEPFGSNLSLRFVKPISNYFFAFSYGLGIVGIVFGAIILAGIVGLFFLSGFWVSEKIHHFLQNRKTGLSYG